MTDHIGLREANTPTQEFSISSVLLLCYQDLSDDTSLYHDGHLKHSACNGRGIWSRNGERSE